MSNKEFLQETNFQDDSETTESENNAQEKRNQKVRKEYERIWNDASLRNGEYWHFSETKTTQRSERHQILHVLLVWAANVAPSEE